MAVNLSALKTELLTDPTSLGYAPLVALGSTGALAELLNVVNPAILVFRETIPTWEVLAGTVKAEYDVLTAGNKQLYQILISAGTLNVANPTIRGFFSDLFGAGTTTRTNLVNTARRNGSRAEQLFGVTVSHQQVAQALRS